MCGISGIIGHNLDPHTIRRMVDVQSHRGPDDSGVYVSPDARAALGHNRLSIIDLSPLGHQPMADATGRYMMVFNGEVYNYRELRRELPDYPYRSNSDSEVILAAYSKWGAGCLEKFIGMFAIAIWDTQEKVLFCARDRLGIKPFHYGWSQGNFYFASEVKAILAAGVDAKADMQSWATFFRHGIYDHSENTFFEGVSVLPAGHMMVVRDGKANIQSFWDLKQKASQIETMSFDQACNAFEALMIDSVKLRMRSDVPVGVNLSGGLDSSSLFSFIDQKTDADGALNYFTYAFDDSQYDETDFADQVPKHKSWNRTIARLSPEKLWDAVMPLMWHEEAPYGGTGTIAYYELHRAIRNAGVIVCLEGQGVDELLAGYAYYSKPASAKGVYQDGTSFLKTESISGDILGLAPSELVFDKPFSCELNNRLYQDIRHTKLPRVLRMNDRLSMASGVELREPFLDHRVVEFCFAQPDDYKLRDGETKAMLRAVMEKYLPQNVRKTPKRPVVTPQREWIRGPLKSRIMDVITSREFINMGVFDSRLCVKMLEDFCEGDGDNAFFVWQWLNYYAWHNIFLKEKRWKAAA